MYRINDNKQQELFDHWDYMGPSRRKLLQNSWAEMFRNDILHTLPVNKLKDAFHSTMGRPSKELHTVIGVMIFQQMFDKTDDEAVDSLCFDIRWHYALNIQDESDQDKYISSKTLWTARQNLIKYHLEEIIFDIVRDTLARLFDVDPSFQRLDSVHIKSNMRKLGRIGIFAKTIIKFLTNLKRQRRDLFDALEQELQDRYLKKDALSTFSMVKPTESSKTLDQVSNDLFGLIQRFKDQSDICNMTSYKLMQRVLGDHCIINSDGTSEVKIELKPPKGVSSSSLQNPSDPDAGFSRHKGQGYQAQIQETFTLEEDPNKKAETLNLITHVAVEPAHKGDSGALIPAIEATEKNDMKPEHLLADTLYGSDDNITVAKDKGVELIAPAPSGKKGFLFNHFTFKACGCIETCPAGHSPISTKHKKNKGNFSCGFDVEICQKCELLDDCPARPSKKHYYVRYTDKVLRLIKRRKHEHTAEFTDIYRWRSGVEATMSQLDRLTRAKHLRVRGFKAVNFSIILKAVGINLLRAAAARKSRIKRSKRGLPPYFTILSNILYFMKAILAVFRPNMKYLQKPLDFDDRQAGQPA